MEMRIVATSGSRRAGIRNMIDVYAEDRHMRHLDVLIFAEWRKTAEKLAAEYDAEIEWRKT